MSDQRAGAHHLRFLRAAAPHHAGTFGADRFGRAAEHVARFFGTPQYIVGQTVLVALWIALNTSALIGAVHFDRYPYILLNLAFSLQAAYAAPLILLAQTRQADRDKAHAEADAAHREEIAAAQTRLIEENTRLTEHVAELSDKIHGLTEAIADRVGPRP
ncbi:MAG: DUF1003 domain-containing protein [Actinobacteria bacterium]|nr:DUF1003 domain-containing protein [Actinomycetota bacterium]